MNKNKIKHFHLISKGTSRIIIRRQRLLEIIRLFIDGEFATRDVEEDEMDIVCYRITGGSKLREARVG